jgi:Rrf2 family cysteine metabolism transcriptional repressor
MMRISTRGRYALRALVDLALHADKGPVSRHAIAERQSISADYVAQLFRQLRTAGLVQGRKGPGGGYVLVRDAATIRVGDVIRAVEGPIAAATCAAPGDDAECARADHCATYLLWRQLSETIETFLDGVTLQDLCDQARHPDGAE